MSKAQEKAFEVYPYSRGDVGTSFGTIVFDQHADAREGFIKGYEMALADLSPFFDAVREMRVLQNVYFISHNYNDLTIAKKAERIVDRLLESIDGKTLF